LLLILSLLPSAAAADAQEVFAPRLDPLRLPATPAQQAIRLDGVLDETAWMTATVATGFVQAEPEQGEPAVEQTEVRVLFDDRHLYIGAICFDSHGVGDLRVRDLRRDFDETTDDFFGMAIDGVGDGRSALVFRVNPAGALRDQQTIDGAPVDVDFDVVWSARTSRRPDGWTVEIAIPWQTLRYRAGLTTWGINFQRVNRRTNENSGWSPWPRVATPFRMDYAGMLTGIEPPARARNIRLLPYILGERRVGDTDVTTADGGGDVKWAVSPSAVVDVTVKPDFGQADVDRQVVNLTRFSVFFPERRQFFLENRSLFFSGNGSRFEPFFSRRIGLDEVGNPIPIRAGARFSVRGRSGAFGAVAVSQGEDSGPEQSEFGVLRYVANFGAQNRLGALVTARHDRGGRTNLVGGIDGYWRLSTTAFVRGTITGSTTSGERSGLGAFVWAANEASWGYLGYVSEVITSGYEAGSGFVLRTDYARISPAVILDWRPSWRPSWIRRFRPAVILEQFVSPATGAVQEGYVPIRPLTAEFHNGGSIQYEVQPNWQEPTQVFRPLPGVDIFPGTYRYTRHLATVQTDPSALVAVRFEGGAGGYFDGSLYSLRSVVQTTPDPRLAVSVDYTVNRLEHVGAGNISVSTHLVGIETRAAANPRLQFVAFVQWNTAVRQLSGNARFTWEYRPLAFFNVIYNHRTPTPGLSSVVPPPGSRQLLAKWTWLFQM
jgi:hypothetical protein